MVCRTKTVNIAMKRSNVFVKDVSGLPSGNFSNHLTSIEISGLSAQDRALVRSVTIITSKKSASSTGGRDHDQDVGEHLVGFECVYCASSPLVSMQSEQHFHKVFPGSIETMAAALQLLREKHFGPEAARLNRRCVLLPGVVRQIFEMPEHQGTLNVRNLDLQTCCMMAALRLGLKNKTPGSRGGIIFNSQTAPKVKTDASSFLSSFAREGSASSRTSAASSFISGAGTMDVKAPIPFSTRPESVSQVSTPYSRQLSELLGTQLRPTSTTMVENQSPSKLPRTVRDISPRGRAISSFSPTRSTFLLQLSGVPFIRDGLGWSCPFCYRLPFQLRVDGSFQHHMPTQETAMNHYMKCPNIPRFSSYPTYPSASFPGRIAMGQGVSPTFLFYPGTPVAEQEQQLKRTSSTDDESSLPSPVQRTPSDSLNENLLAMPEDKLLLTDYFYFINQQLRICHFREEDRNTRGGKRKNIKIGSGGIACIHCYGKPKARKFFWNDVDRLANSFSEIAVHVQKCAYCPDDVKYTMMELKARHAEQMTSKPRGWQKVFFRRMWRRIHGYHGLDEEEVAGESAEDSTAELQEAKQTGDIASGGVISPPSSRGACPLAIPEDKQWLSDSDCLIRSCLEVFIATEENVKQHSQISKKGAIKVGQVGIRCIYCASSPQTSGGKGSFIYPPTINDIYDSVREIQRSHLHTCVNIPEGERAKLSALKTASSCSTVVRRYYIVAAKGLKLELYDTDSGIRANREVQMMRG